MRNNAILQWSRSAFLFCIPLSSYVSVRLLILVLAISLFHPFNFRKIGNSTWDISAYMLVLLAGLLYTFDKTSGWNEIETSFSLIALPIAFRSNSDSDTYTPQQAFGAFCSGLVVTCLVCLGAALNRYLTSHDITEFFFYHLTEVVGSHPTYLTYFLIASITYGLHLLYYGNKAFPRSLVFCVTIFFFAMLLLTGGRTAYTSLLLILSFFVLKFLLEERTRIKSTAFAATCFMLAGMFGFSTLEYFDLSFESDYWERSILWESAIKANPNPVFGVGTGDYRNVLNNYFTSHGLDQFAAENYNAHNQFVHTYFSNGLIGLLALLAMLGWPLYVSLQRGNTVGITLWFPFLIYGMTEVYLGRYQGVVFFALMHQLTSAIGPSDKRDFTNVVTEK